MFVTTSTIAGALGALMPFPLHLLKSAIEKRSEIIGGPERFTLPPGYAWTFVREDRGKRWYNIIVTDPRAVVPEAITLKLPAALPAAVRATLPPEVREVIPEAPPAPTPPPTPAVEPRRLPARVIGPPRKPPSKLKTVALIGGAAAAALTALGFALTR